MVLTPDENVMEQKCENNENNFVENNIDEVSGPITVTNFSIEEILKPNFGTKRFSVNIDTSYSAFTPVRNTERNLPGYLPFRRQSCSPSPSCSSGTSSPGTTPSPTTTPTTPITPGSGSMLYPAWVYCTRYSDRPSSGPRSRKVKGKKEEKQQQQQHDDKRPRTAFTNEQLQRLKREFECCRYLSEKQRNDLANELDLTEAQIKIWFQNKRAKIKKTSGMKNTLALSLMSQGLYNHSTTVTVKEEHSMDLSS